MQALIVVILPVFIVIGFGYLAAAKRYLSETSIDTLMKFTQNFAIPCLLFGAIYKINIEQIFQLNLLISFYLGAGLGFIFGLFGARYLFKKDWETSVSIGFCCLFSNTVILGLAITESAYGMDALTGNFAIVALHAPFCYGVGITAMEITRNRNQNIIKMAKNVFRAMFKNAIVVSIALGILVNLLDILIPRSFFSAINMIAEAALPTALFALGGVLYRYRPEGNIGPIVMVIIISLIIHPSLVWIFGRLFYLDENSFRSAVLTSAMAPGVNTYLFANMYDKGQRIAASGILLSTALSVFTVWVWLNFLN